MRIRTGMVMMILPMMFFTMMVLILVRFIIMMLVVVVITLMMLVFMAKARFMNRVRTGLFLTAFFTIYACLVCYEFVHLMRVL